MSTQLPRLFGRTALPLLLACTLALGARAAERGFPLMSVYPAEVHKAGPQNFDIAQDRDGVLYFGNLHGLVIYDGAWWRLVELPDDQVALSLATDDKGRLAMGLVNDFGYLARDAQGSPLFRSLREQLPESAREVGDIRDICTTAAGFLFVAERSLLLWDGVKAPSVIATFDAESAPRGCLSEGADVLLRGPKGLQRFDPATRRITPTGVTGRVQLVLRRHDGKLIAVIRDQGLVLLDGNTVTPWAPAAGEWLKGDSASGGARLQDGRLVITARQSGLAILDPNGNVEQILRDAAGLPDALIRAAMVDREGALWLAMEGPIVRIDLGSPVSVFDARRGLKGGASDVVRFNGRLHAATSYGVHVIDEHGNATLIEELNVPGWRLLPIDGEMLVANSKGLWSIGAGGSAKHLIEREAELYDLHRSKTDPSRVWIAERYGVSSVRRTASGWQPEPAIEGMPQYTTWVVEHEGVLWCGSTFNGVLRVDDPRGPRQRVQQFGDDEMNVFLAGGRPVFVRAKAGQIVALNDAGKFIPDPLLGHITAPRGFFVLAEDAKGNIWINSTPPRVFERMTGGRYAEQGEPLVSVTAADIQTLRANADGVWFASDKGLFRYDPAAAPRVVAVQPAPRIRRVVAGENRLLYGGAGTGQGVELRHNFGRMRLEFAPVSYRPGIEYQYRLDPMDGNWSEWTAQPFIDYTTLEPSDYTFRLRARGAGTVASAETRWSFSVRPPWYRTTWAYVLWALLAAALVTLIIRVRTAALQRQAETLRARVDEKTSELQETVQLLEQANTRLEALSLEDDLTGIANRRSFERALSDEWNRARRHEHPLALILLDLDHFKELNDRRGHPAGDDCLRRVGAFLADAIRRSGEVVARYGGEEFAILLPGTDAEGAIRVAESLRDGIEQLAVPIGNGRRMTTSCGVAAMIPSPRLTGESLVASADRALYAAKHSGRNCVRVADETTTGTWLRDVSA